MGKVELTEDGSSSSSGRAPAPPSAPRNLSTHIRTPALMLSGHRQCSSGQRIRSPFEIVQEKQPQYTPEEVEEWLEEVELADDEDDGLDTSTGEFGGPKGSRYNAEPTRYNDWEVKGRVSDF